jgi:hypothetical protein
MDLRVARSFKIGECVSLQGLFEFFNRFNVGNPAAVQTLENALEAEYIFAGCSCRSRFSCSSAADHTCYANNAPNGSRIS